MPSAALFRQVRADLEDELRFLHTRIAEGVLEPAAVLTELCRPREALIRYAEPRTLFINTPEEAPARLVARLVARFIQRDADEVERRREELLARQVRQTLTGLHLNTAFTEHKVGTEQFQVRLPFVHQRNGEPRAAIKPLDLTQDAPQKIYEHGAPWIQRLKWLGKTTPLPLLIPTRRPPVDDTQRQQACREVEAELQALTGVDVVSVDDAAPIIAFAQRHAVPS